MELVNITYFIGEGPNGPDAPVFPLQPAHTLVLVIIHTLKQKPRSIAREAPWCFVTRNDLVT